MPNGPDRDDRDDRVFAPAVLDLAGGEVQGQFSTRCLVHLDSPDGDSAIQGLEQLLVN